VKPEPLPHAVLILLSRLGLHHLHYCVYIPQILPANFSNNLRNIIDTRSPKKGEEPRDLQVYLLTAQGRSRSVKTRPPPRPPLLPAVCPYS
jgi:hypothetical protein